MYKEDLMKMMGEFKKYCDALPEEMSGFKEMHDKALVDKALSRKTKELMALAISVCIRCDGCILSHVGTLVQLGTTREEIIETLGVALFMGGGPATAYGCKALAVYDELSAK